MTTARTSEPARTRAIAAARPLFYRPDREVDRLIAHYAALPEQAAPGAAELTRACYREPVAMAATMRVFALRALHWPMLNLLESAERQRRAFADAMAEAIVAALHTK